jgi:hypothetical protein
MVKPILLYGSEIWGFSKNIQGLEKVQLRFCKLLLKLKTSKHQRENKQNSDKTFYGINMRVLFLYRLTVLPNMIAFLILHQFQ